MESYSFVQTKNSAIVQTIEPRMMLCGCSKIIVKPSGKVITIEPSADALSVEEVDKLFCTVFKQFCALKVVDKLAVDRLTHELTTAEVTAVFRGRGLGRAAHPEPQLGVHP